MGLEMVEGCVLWDWGPDLFSILILKLHESGVVKGRGTILPRILIYGCSFCFCYVSLKSKNGVDQE